MGVRDLIQASQFLIDADGNKTGVVLEYPVWEELLTLLEDIEDAEEIRGLREIGAERIPWIGVRTRFVAKTE